MLEQTSPTAVDVAPPAKIESPSTSPVRMYSILGILAMLILGALFIAREHFSLRPSSISLNTGEITQDDPRYVSSEKPELRYQYRSDQLGLLLEYPEGFTVTDLGPPEHALLFRSSDMIASLQPVVGIVVEKKSAQEVGQNFEVLAKAFNEASVEISDGTRKISATKMRDFELSNHPAVEYLVEEEQVPIDSKQSFTLAGFTHVVLVKYSDERYYQLSNAALTQTSRNSQAVGFSKIISSFSVIN